MAKILILKSSELETKNFSPEYYFKKYPKRDDEK
jgi:hypothetical protein